MAGGSCARRGPRSALDGELASPSCAVPCHDPFLYGGPCPTVGEPRHRVGGPRVPGASRGEEQAHLPLLTLPHFYFLPTKKTTSVENLPPPASTEVGGGQGKEAEQVVAGICCARLCRGNRAWPGGSCQPGMARHLLARATLTLACYLLLAHPVPVCGMRYVGQASPRPGWYLASR